MIQFRIINYIEEINLSNSWIDSPNFKDKNKIVEYEGRKYQLIAQKERSFSCLERIQRGFLGVIAACCSLFSEFLKNQVTSESIKDLFTQEKEVIRFGIRPDEEIQQINVLAVHLPGRHSCCKCRITYNDGHIWERYYPMSEFRELARHLPHALDPFACALAGWKDLSEENFISLLSSPGNIERISVRRNDVKTDAPQLCTVFYTNGQREEPYRISATQFKIISEKLPEKISFPEAQ